MDRIIPMRKMDYYPSLNAATRAALRPLERLARYLNGDDLLVKTAEQQADDYLKTLRNPPPRDLLVTAFRGALPIENRAARDRFGALVLAVQKTKFPRTSPEAANFLKREMIRRNHDPLWAETLLDFVANAHRARLHRCANPGCRRWFVDNKTRAGVGRCCQRDCMVTVTNAERPSRARAKKKGRR